MLRRSLAVAGSVVALALAAGWTPLRAAQQQQQQLPLAPVRAAGLTVTPAFEGWYPNRDGTHSLSFGYYNRNSDEVLEIPIGPNNFIEPGEPDQGQPTHFQPGRHWGVFAVTVPADFGNQRVVWTLKVRGETFAIPGSLKIEWQIDALEGEVGSENTPPLLKFDPAGPEGAGPAGIMAPAPLATKVGSPLTVTVWASDDGRGGRNDQPPVTLTWFKHQGPGEVTFSEPSPTVDEAGGKAATMATFSEPGNYLLRVRANDASGVSNAGHAQCCWSNGFVKVTVSR